MRSIFPLDKTRYLVRDFQVKKYILIIIRQRGEKKKKKSGLIPLHGNEAFHMQIVSQRLVFVNICCVDLTNSLSDMHTHIYV